MRTNKLYFTLLIALLATAGSAFAQVASFAPPERIVTGRLLLSVDKLRPGDTFSAAFKATVRKGYHIGAHDKDSLYPAKLTMKAPKGITFGKPIYPKGERKAFPGAPNEKIPVYDGAFTIEVKGHVAKNARPGPVTITARLDTQGCKGDQCYPPETTTSTVKTRIVAGSRVAAISRDVSGPAVAAGTQGAAAAKAGTLERMHPATRTVALFFGGILLAFTPCVYPMIPVTFGYFSNQTGKKRRAALLAGVYVLGIALTYSILGTVAAATGGVFGAAMQSTPVVVGIAGVLVLLALSMFGLYELQAPAFIQSRASGRSGVLGALVMGLIFGVVAAPCVGPMVLGLLLLAAKIGSPVAGFFLFFPLALGIGTPLFFIALFSARMPQPGMWMVAVKKIAGFLLLGVAAYFLLPVLPDQVGRYLIPLILLAAGIYLGFFEPSIRSSRVGTSLGKAFGGVAAVVAVFMLLPASPKTTHLTWQPYTPAKLSQAAKAHKPVMLDFTAKWCGYCKELERGPFSDPTVVKAAQRFTRLRVDGTNQNDQTMLAAVKRFNVQGFPTIIFFNPKGEEVGSARVVGYVDSGELMKRMAKAK